MNILVTGGDGFIGSHLVEQLVEAGHSVRVLQRRSQHNALRIGHLQDDIQWRTGDCGDPVDAISACRGIELVYHFASSTNASKTWSDPVREVRDGILRSVSFMESAATAGVGKFALASSGGTVYGRQAGKLREDTLLQPFSPYGIGKYAVELFAESIRARTGMQVDAFRISNPYGRHQPSNTGQGVVAVWIDCILNDRPLQVFGGDETRRDYIYVDDACRLITHVASDVNRSGTYNVCSGTALLTLELLNLFKEIIPAAFEFNIAPRRDFDNITTQLDNTEIMSRVGEFEFVPIEDGLRKTWQWYSEQHAESLRSGGTR